MDCIIKSAKNVAKQTTQGLPCFCKYVAKIIFLLRKDSECSTKMIFFVFYSDDDKINCDKFGANNLVT